ncbi:hypothetical protein E3P91_01928 [Wallemia ichthyophaga]|nr:hypothetical protein E3P91_01928 [Wallemia ichthyophaga]
MHNLPHPHTPTKEELLGLANGFFERLRIRWKWWTIRGFRKFNADDVSAFISWLLVGHIFWILIGTTTFFSAIFATANSLRLQNYIAGAISDYLTQATGVTVAFENAILPKWKDSRISFKNVHVSRHSGGETLPPVQPDSAAVRRKIIWDDHAHVHDEDHDLTLKIAPPPPQETWTMFDINLDSVDVELSLWRWLDGKGLVKDASIKGIRGVLDRRGVKWDYDNPLDPKDFRHPHHPGDFELESLTIEDLLITVYQPEDFRPYNMSIFRGEIGTFRKQWLFHDLLAAYAMTGQFDNSLFSLHKPQSITRTHNADVDRVTRFRIDGVAVDHLQAAAGMTGPTAWITHGKMDAVVDITFPFQQDEDLFDAIMESINNLNSAVQDGDSRIPGQAQLTRPALKSPDQTEQQDEPALSKERVAVDIDLRFRDVKASVPYYTSDLTYTNNALVRPIVAFINSNRTLIPILSHVELLIDEFDGSWTMWETGLMSAVSDRIYDALAHHVTSTEANNQRVKSRKIVQDGVFQAELSEFFTRELSEEGFSGCEVRVTHARTEIIIRATHTQEVLGEKGRRIRELTALVQKRFKFPENSLELYAEKVQNRGLSAVAQCESLRYKLLGGLAVRRACYGVVRFIMESGAKGCEVVVSGKLRAARAKAMKFTDGFMIHSGQPVRDFVDYAVRHVLLKQGVLGLKVKIMRPHDPEGRAGFPKPLPDSVVIVEPKEEQPVQVVSENKAKPNVESASAPAQQQQAQQA